MDDLVECVARKMVICDPTQWDAWADKASMAIDITLEAAAASLWDDLPEIQRKNIRLNHKQEHQYRQEFAADIRAMKGRDDD